MSETKTIRTGSSNSVSTEIKKIDGQIKTSFSTYYGWQEGDRNFHTADGLWKIVETKILESGCPIAVGDSQITIKEMSIDNVDISKLKKKLWSYMEHWMENWPKPNGKLDLRIPGLIEKFHKCGINKPRETWSNFQNWKNSEVIEVGIEFVPAGEFLSALPSQ